MTRTAVSLVVHPRSGANLARVRDVVAALAAGGWKAEVLVKDAGHGTMELARGAAAAGADYVVAFGGDGTLNHVANGVLASGRRDTVVGLIPGGTANVWAAEVGIPPDSISAARALIESRVRTMDVGYVRADVPALEVATSRGESDATPTAGRRRHFLLMAGLGADAELMRRTPRGLKHRLGVAAVVLTAARVLPLLRPFPLRVGRDDGEQPLWEGTAVQLVVGNTRRYGNVVSLTPDAQADSGALDLAIVPARSLLGAIARVAAIAFRGRPSPEQVVSDRSPGFVVHAPASVGLQLDGSAVSLERYLTPAAVDAIARAGVASGVMVRYHIEAVPRALRVAVPSAYRGVLFRHD